MSRLTGKRILITRAPRQAGGLADALAMHGAEVLLLPAIDFCPPESYGHLDSLLEQIGTFAYLIVTSANGVAALADRLQLLGIGPQRLTHLHIVAVGPATAVALERIGLTAGLVPDQYVAEAVVTLLQDRVRGQRVLLCRAAVARDIIPQELRKCGADIHVAEAYRTVVPTDSVVRVRALLAGEPLPDAVTFTSSSTVNNFFTLLAAAGMDLPGDLRAVSIGPITSGTLRRHAWEPAEEAVDHHIPGLVEACLRLLA